MQAAPLHARRRPRRVLERAIEDRQRSGLPQTGVGGMRRVHDCSLKPRSSMRRAIQVSEERGNHQHHGAGGLRPTVSASRNASGDGAPRRDHRIERRFAAAATACRTGARPKAQPVRIDERRVNSETRQLSALPANAACRRSTQLEKSQPLRRRRSTPRRPQEQIALGHRALSGLERGIVCAVRTAMSRVRARPPATAEVGDVRTGDHETSDTAATESAAVPVDGGCWDPNRMTATSWIRQPA